MRPGEEFENRCYEYLKSQYETDAVSFQHEGGMDSTKSDIAVIKNGRLSFYIEAKDTAAQSGQFVLLPDEKSKTFVFSPRNRSKINETTQIMIDYMNKDFDRFNNAGTAGKALLIDAAVFSKWIIGHYVQRGVKYVISYKNGFVIIPISKFEEYFDISATYRIKKSGSGEPAKRDMPAVKSQVQEFCKDAVFSINGKKLIVNTNADISRKMFVMGAYTYYFSDKGNNVYEIRRLSNTYNMNVIFSIKLKKTQVPEDLQAFLTEL